MDLMVILDLIWFDWYLPVVILDLIGFPMHCMTTLLHRGSQPTGKLLMGRSGWAPWETARGLIRYSVDRRVNDVGENCPQNQFIWQRKCIFNNSVLLKSNAFEFWMILKAHVGVQLKASRSLIIYLIAMKTTFFWQCTLTAPAPASDRPWLSNFGCLRRARLTEQVAAAVSSIAQAVDFNPSGQKWSSHSF